MSDFANTPNPPYYAVIFSSKRTEIDRGYLEMAQKMEELARQQDGFLGMETVRDEIGITVSYWKDPASIKNWKNNIDHIEAQRLGREKWYSGYKIRIAKVEKDYGM